MATRSPPVESTAIFAANSCSSATRVPDWSHINEEVSEFCRNLATDLEHDVLSRQKHQLPSNDNSILLLRRMGSPRTEMIVSYIAQDLLKLPLPMLEASRTKVVISSPPTLKHTHVSYGYVNNAVAAHGRF